MPGRKAMFSARANPAGIRHNSYTMKTKITLNTPGLLKLALMALASVLLPGMLSAQLTGTRNIPGDYATLALAITDLNTQGVGAGGVTLNLLAGNPETAPVGGYQITASGTLADPIIIQGNANVITAATQTAGSLNDAIFKILGGDFIAINGFVMQENPANTVLTPAGSNTMTEWGVALLYASATNGAQNNAIAGNTITLNRAYGNSWGVYSNTRHTATAITIVADVTAISGTNSNNRVNANIISNVNYGVAFIGSTTAANMDFGNDVGGTSALTGNTFSNFGGLGAISNPVSNTGTSYGVFMNNQTADNVSFNTFTTTLSGTSITFRAIFKDYSGGSPTGTFTSSINNNSFTIASNFTASGTFEHIRSQGMGALATATININNNSIIGSSVTNTSTIVGIINASAPGILSMSNNIIRGLTSNAASGGFTGISNTGAVVSSITLSNNQLGNASGNAITYSIANSGAILGINNSGGASTAALTMSSNNFQGIVHSVTGSGTQFYMVNSAATLSQTITNNTFTNLTANTTAEVRMIANNVALPATGFATVTGNSIVTGFSKPGAGSTVTLYYTTTIPSSAVGTVKTYQNNNFSNITLTGATVMAGWADLEGAIGGGSTKNISNNTFTNWTCGSSAVNVIQTNYNGNNTSISNNTINAITGSGAITAISIGSFSGGAAQSLSNNTISSISSTGTGGNVTGISAGSSSITTLTISLNTISGLSSNGASTVSGIIIPAGSTTNCFRNRIGDLLTTSASGFVNGITMGGGTTTNVYNNLVGDLRATVANAANVINGINISGGTNANAYFNTVYLNATSTGVNFGTSGINASTTPNVDLRNNLVVNLSTPAGTGFTVAYRRSTTTLTSYVATSNNNSFYAGVPSASNLIFFDGTNADQTLAAYQARVSSRDAGSVSENPIFTSTAVANPGFLHIPAASSYLLESGGSVIATITTDFDNDTRPGPAGSVNGGALSPDIGADEYDGLLVGCTGTPTAGTAASTPAARCASGTFSLSLTGASTGPSITYQWRSSTVSGGPYTNISGANTPSFTTGSVSTTTYFVCVVTCSISGLTATTNEVTGTINPLPLVSVTPTSANFCSPGGTPASLTGSGASTYAWAPATGLSATTGASVTASPASTTTYTVTGTDANGCVNTAVTTITAVLNPVITSVTATPATICAGNNSQLQGNINFNTPVNTYSFASGTGASLDPMTGATTAVGANVDDTPSGVIPIGFTFNFNGVNYTDFSVSPDGWVRMGNVAPTAQFTNSVTSTTNIPKLYPYWDNVTTGTNGGVTYVVTGTAPNRILKVQWFVTIPYNLTGAANSTCQAWLYESTNVVEFRYGTMGITGLELASGGLTGGATNFQSLTFSTGTVSTTAANNSNINPPASGVIYTFTPPVPTYSWSPATFLSSTSIANPVATAATATTTYTLTATNAVCSNNSPVTLTVNPLPTIGASASASAICIGASTNLTATGAVTYTWMPGSLTGATVTVSPVSTTTYTVTGTDANGCENTAQITITVNTLPAVNASASPAAICDGSTANLTATGAVSYAWMPGSLSGAAVAVTPSATTTYTVTGTDGNGCENTAQVTVSVNSLPTVNASASATSICAGASTTLSASGANTYVWNPGNLSGASVSVSPATTTTYTVTGTDGNGCDGVSTITITVNPLPTVAASATPAAVCAGSSSTLSATGAVTYVWNPGNLSGASVTVTPSATTTYTVTGTDANGCENTDVATVTINALPTVTATASASSICTGSSTTLNASGAVTYNWMPGSLSGASVTVSPAVTTTYTVTGTDANGCENTAQITITVNPLPTVSATASPAAVCPGGASTLSGSGAATYVWNPGNLSGASVSVTPSATTTYTVTGTDANGCVNTDVVTVTVNTLPTVDATATPLTICTGASSTLAATGAATYTWMPGSLSGASVSVTPATTTTYTVTGTDANGCQNTDVVTVTVNPLPTITASTTNAAICVGSSTTLNATGGVSYTWMPGSLTGASVSVSPITSTTYTVTGTDANGCQSTDLVTITVNPLPTVSATASSAAICVGGSSTLTATGASTYTWMPGSLSGASVIVSPVATTTYTVTGTDANGCVNTGLVTVTVNTLPTVSASASPATICVGASSTLTASGATTYTWMPGSLSGASVSVTPATTTTYTLTGTDANGCVNTDVVTVTVNPLPTITASATNAAICTGSSTTLSATGGVSYTWNPGALSGSSVSVSPTASTTYTVSGTDANGCVNTDLITIIVNPLPVVTASASSTSICTGNSVTLTAGGASTYTWNPGALSGASVVVTPAITTTYTVTGTDVNGCVNTQTVTITVGAQPTITAAASASAICVGGSATLTATGGVTYNWMPGSLSGASVSVTPTTTTTYTVTGTVSAGCFNTATVTVTVNPLPVITASASATTICNGASTTLSASGASTYTWNPGALTGASVTVTPSATTTYTVTGVDANGCSNTQTITITVNPLPAVTASTSAAAICNGGSATLTATGANTYVWNPGNLSGTSVVVSPTATTTYTVTGTNTSTGCTNTATVSVTVNPLPSITATATQLAVCAGASSTLSATGANTYVWNPGNLSGSSVTVTPAGTTTYTVTGTNTVTGCVNTRTITITVNPLPTVAASTSAATICNGGSATLSATGANTYVWNPGNLSGASVSVSPTATTTYTVTGTITATGCTNTATVAVTVNPLPVITASTSAPAICVGGSATLSATGGNTYVWNPGNLSGATISVSPTATTTYTVTGTNTVTGCVNTATVSVTVNPLPVVAASSAAAAICVGGSTTLTATGANTYVWNPGNLSGSSVSVSPTATTTYTVTGTNSTTGCTNTATVAVTVNPLPTVAATTTAATICNGASTTLSATGANTYVWNPGNLSGSSVSVSPTATTTYTVTGTITATGCTNTATVAITVNPLPVIAASTSAPAICVGGSATLSATGGNTYVWNPGNLSGATISVSPTATTTYTVTGTNTVTGCSNTRTVTVTVNPLPVVTASSAAAAICAGGSTTLTATGANTYVWNPGNLSGSSVSVSPTATTTYTVTGTNTATGCINTATVSVTVNPLPTVAATTSAATICAGGSATLSATGANTYVWNPGNLSGSSVTVTPAATTTYTVTGTNTVTGCTNTQTVTVNVNPLPVLTITPSATSICSGNSVTLNATGANTYTWNPGNLTGASVTVFLSSTTTFTLTGVNTITGCINTRTVTITVNPLPVITATASPLSICAGGSTTLSATGANTYVWNPGNLTGSSVSVSPATSTVYTVTGTNTVTGCSASQSVSVNVDALPVVVSSASSAVICAGQSTTLSASGASSYVWNPGNLIGSSVTVTPAATTTYTVTGTNSLTGCTNTSTITITGNPLPVLVTTATSLTVCAGSPTTLTATGAGSYTWNPGNLSGASVTVSPAITTTYTVTGTNTVTGCVNTQTITINVNQLPVITASAAQAVICAGASSNLTATGANTYVWNPGNLSGAVVTVTPAATTTYTVTGTNTVTGCVNTQTVTVTVNALPVVAAASAAAAICVGDTTTLTGTGADTYTWNPGNLSGSTVSVSPVATTTYTVTGTNTVTGCVNTATVSVTVNALPVLAATSSSAAVCVGDSTTLSVTGANSYTWNPGNLSGASVNVAPVATTTYTVTGTNTVTGCVNTTTVAVTVNSLPVVALGADTAVCGGPLTLDAANTGSTYLWSDSSTAQTLSVTASGVYAVTVTNANGCEAVDSISVTINALPVVSLGVDTTVCGSLVLDAGNAGASYLWSDSTTAQTLTATASGVYSVMVTDSLGCSMTDTIAVNVNALPAVNLGNDVTACAGGPVLLDAGVAGMIYNWNTGDTTQTIFATTTGVFAVTATDSLGCSATDSVNVSFSALPVVNLGNDTTLCGGSVTLDAGTGGNIFTWSTGDTTQTILATSTALYGVTVTDSLGCSSTDSVLVTINAIPVVSLSLTQDTLCDQDSLFVLLGSPAGGTFGGAFVNGNTFDPVAAGVGSHVVYYTFTDANGCSATDSATVIVDPCTGVAENVFNGSLFTVYPNPNNGFFNLAITNANYAELSIQVYTVLGQVVYSDMVSNVTGDVIRPIDLTNFANGAYYVKVTTGAATQTVKVMKQD